jgi:acyl-CoA synthetase (AMP-forming)/AMP-acid ligase II
VVAQAKGVQAVAVVAKPDSHYGEVPVAFVVADSKVTEREQVALRAKILDRCQAQLAKFKVPHEVIFIPELPRVGFGKISKAKLREQLGRTQVP